MLSKLLRCIIRGYQVCISGARPPCCRFIPTCSEYALDAIRTRGPLAGIVLALWRLMRCNPLCKGGYDPVPPPVTRKKI